MRISHRYRFVFLSNPKCGSTTVRTLLDPFSDISSAKNNWYFLTMLKQLLFIENFKQCPRESYQSFRHFISNFWKDTPYRHHVSAKDLKSHFESMQWNWASYYSFLFIRNPWDRAVSFFFYGKQNNNSIWNEWAKDVDFATFIKDERVINKLVDYSFINFACDANNKVLVNQVIKLEEIDIALSILLKEIGVKKMHFIPTINKSKRLKNYKKYYDNDTRLIVQKIFGGDIEIGKYIF